MAPKAPTQTGNETAKTKKYRDGTSRNLKNKIKSSDYFGQTYSMRIDKNQERITSWGGAVCSILLFLVIGSYTYQKLDILINKRDIDLITMTASHSLTLDERFDASMGFSFAAAFLSYDGNSEPIDDPTVGEVVFNNY